MEKKYWKAIAITFGISFILMVLINLLSIATQIKESERTNQCYYEVCEGYPEATLIEDICSCYDYDLIGDLVVAKEKYMRG